MRGVRRGHARRPDHLQGLRRRRGGRRDARRAPRRFRGGRVRAAPDQKGRRPPQGPFRVRDGRRVLRGAVARAGADRGQDAALPLHAVPGHPRAEFGPVPGRARGESFLGRRRRRARLVHGAHVGAPGERPPLGDAVARFTGGLQPVLLQAARADVDVPRRHSGGGPRAPRDLGPLRGLVRALCCGRGARGVLRDGAVPRGRGGDHGPALRLGPLRPRVPRAVVPLRRHGEPVFDVCDAHAPRRGPEFGRRRRARDRALVDGQSRDKRDVEPLLAQRGLDALARAQDQGHALRQGRRGADEEAHGL
mmetsp:Transcript_27543/g.91146  ORF Transcript_27543/g.91146 Transcript_27543/m.91146 type:complete len:306 (+) Transcript_27543:353-1270(+)